MKTSSSSEIVRAAQALEIQRSNAQQAKPKPYETPAPALRPDSVSISDAGRAMAAQAADNGSELTPERISQIKERILSGAYNSLEIVDQVARSMVASGDI